MQDAVGGQLAPSLDYEAFHDAIRRLAVRLGGGRVGGGLVSAALAGPDLVVYAGRVLADERVPRATRGEIIASVVYIASPFDVVPESLFGPAGLVDDALVAARLLDVLLNRVDPAVARRHWPGDRAALETLQRLAAEGRKLFGAGFRQGLRLLARRGLRGVARLVRDSGWLPPRLLGAAAPPAAPP